MKRAVLLTLSFSAMLLLLSVIFFGASASASTESTSNSQTLVNSGLSIVGLDQFSKVPSTVETQFHIHWSADILLCPPTGSCGFFGTNNYLKYVYEPLIASGISFVGTFEPASLALGGSGDSSWTITNWDLTVQRAVIDYPGIHAWQVWIEPDTGAHNSSPHGYLYLPKGTPCTSPLLATAASHYTKMLEDAYNIIRSSPGHSNDEILGLSDSVYMYDNSMGGVLNCGAYNFAQYVMADGGGNYMTAASFHMYTHGHLFSYKYKDGQTTAEFLTGVMSKFEALVNKPIWITETGFNTQSDSLQSEWINQLFAFLHQNPYIQAVFYYNYNSYSSVHGYWGLWKGNTGVARASAYVYASYA